MSWIRLILSAVFSFIVVLGLFLLVGYTSIQRSLPKKEGQFTISSLNKSVNVWRDEWGIPHIEAQNEIDLYLAVGFVSAQDRLWQMDMIRRAARGELAEIFGEKSLPFDKMARTIGFRSISEKVIKNLPAPQQEFLSAYTQGINAFIEQHSKRLSPEFTILRYKPKPWKNEDSLAIIRLFAWLSSMGWHTDLFYGDLLTIFSPDAIRDLMLTLNDFSTQYFSLANKDYNGFLTPFPPDLSYSTFFPGVAGLGSQCWTVSGSSTRSGLPLLANDVHMPFTTLSFFYIMHWRAPQINVVGTGIPGIPAIMRGRNNYVAWGSTNAMIDDVDFFVESIDREDSTRYQYHGKNIPFDIREELIPIRGQDPYKLTITASVHGPVINQFFPSPDTSFAPVTVCWTGFEASDEFSVYHQLIHAQNWDHFTDALSTFKIPGQMFHYADVKGNMGSLLAAAVPVRNGKSGLFPLLGQSGQNEWKGYVPYPQLPRNYNPKSQQLISANNRIQDNQHYLSGYWEPSYRYERISALLNQMNKATVDSLARMQVDIYSSHASAILPVLLPYLQAFGYENNTLEYDGIQLLKSWDYKETEWSLAASLFELFYINIIKHTFADEFGPSYEDFCRLFHVKRDILDRLLVAGQSTWFDDQNTPDYRETLSDVAKKSFEVTMNSLFKNGSEKSARWQWVQREELTFPHPLGTVSGLGWFFNSGKLITLTNDKIINKNETFCPSSFKSYMGSCMRQIVDLENETDYYVVLTTGQSGHPLSPNYKDQTKLWQKGELVRLSLDIENSKDLWDLLQLQPSTN